jgi:hypothetical protein
MIDKIRTSISIILVIVLVSIITFFFVGGGKKTDEKLSETPKVEQPKQTSVEELAPSAQHRVWRGSDYGLPAGVIVDGEADDNDPSINWLCIQQSDGHMVIVKSVDKILWVAIQKGDIIE